MSSAKRSISGIARAVPGSNQGDIRLTTSQVTLLVFHGNSWT